MKTVEILESLIGFDTVSRNANMALINYVAELFDAAGISYTILKNETGDKGNLYASVGPLDRGGVMLSGHTDVVPVTGQDWTKDPFRLTVADGRYYGRGTTDMKGFVACAVAALLKANSQNLKTPLHLALSYDEEIGCLGVHSLIDMLDATPYRPAMCIVGEPTNLAVATGHKGKTALKAVCKGKEGHSALAPFALNALHLACDFVAELRDMQYNLAQSGPQDADYDVPYTTVHVGKIIGGDVLNIVPNRCEVFFEIRNIAQDNPCFLMDEMRQRAKKIVTQAKEKASEANIEITITNSYPGLNTPTDAKVVEFVKGLTMANDTIKVAYGTEGGLFSSKIDVPTVICGPGSMAQGHKPDEYVSIEQIERCDAMLERLIAKLC
jgi:acetylornithine deacetylase